MVDEQPATASELWIDRPLRAWCFLSCFLVATLGIVVADTSLPWQRAASVTLSEDALTDDRIRSVADLARAVEGREPIVLLLGGSAMRELLPADALLSSELSTRCGTPLRVVNVATSSQSIAESWIFADAVPDERLAAVIVAANSFRLVQGREQTHANNDRHRLALPPSTALEAALDAPGRPFIPLRLVPVSFGRFLSGFGHEATVIASGAPPLGVRPIPSNPYQDVQHGYASPALSSSRKSELARRILAHRLPYLVAHSEDATALWVEFTKHLAAESVSVTFLVLPESRELSAATRALQPFEARLLERVAAAGAAVDDWRDVDMLEAAHFFDQQHLLEAGRRALAPFAFERLALDVGCERDASSP